MILEVVRRRARAGREEALATWVAEVSRVASGFPGHAGVVTQSPGVPGEPWTLVVRWVSDEAFERWRSSDLGRDWLARGDELSEDVAVDTLHGVEAFFPVAGGPWSRSPGS